MLDGRINNKLPFFSDKISNVQNVSLGKLVFTYYIYNKRENDFQNDSNSNLYTRKCVISIF